MIRPALLATLLASAAQGQTLSFPGNATLTAEEVAPASSYPVPTGPWSGGMLPVETREGTVTTQSWRIAAPGLTTLQLLRPLRAQLAAAGLVETFACETAQCGGFDFRFATPVLPPPQMQVNLGDFRFLSATNADSAVTLLVSRTGDAGFVQVTSVGGALAARADAAPARDAGAPDLATALDTLGHVALDGLSFASGSARLAEGDSPALAALAGYMADNPDVTIALVGHTDSAGALEGNIALSRQRAASVLERLATAYDVPRRRMEAQGMGYLAPRADNRTEAGRAQNRRVEAIVTSTQ